MSRKRSKYRPRPVMSDPLSLMRPASQEKQNDVMLMFYVALEELARGQHPGEADWRALADAVNTVETLALHQGKLDAKQTIPLVSAATVAMVRAAERFKAGQGMRLDALGLQAVRDVVDIYGQCLQAFTEREMAQAQAETQRRVNELLRSKTPNNQVVSL
jgi:hypothetical protein